MAGAIPIPKEVDDTDRQRVATLASGLEPDGRRAEAETVVELFWQAVAAARAARPAALCQRDEALPEDWHHEPFYYLYVQYFGTPGGAARATFDDLIAQLDYLGNLGISNLYLLPHYESPMADGGYDVSELVPRAELGGQAAYLRFMEAANQRGFRVVTDAVFNHTSTRHPWFLAALAGDPEKVAYYLRVDGREKVDQLDVDGDIVCRYRDPDGTETDLIAIFPDVSLDHELAVETATGERIQFFREFYPFQVDLDLQNPRVLGELFRVVGRELNEGVLGKRTDAIAHWIKQAGTANDGLPETHALHGLLKMFVRMVSPRAVIMPEAVRSAEVAAEYSGDTVTIAGGATASEGDALFAFELQGALREMIYFQTSRPYWMRVFSLPELPAGATWVNLLEHHDETYLGFITAGQRPWLAQHIESCGGRVYKNGMSAGARWASCVHGDPRRVASSLFCLYLTPGTPAIYYGTEIGRQLLYRGRYG